MIAKGKSISHGAAALAYDYDKTLEDISAATEVCRNEVYGESAEEVIEEMRFYQEDFSNVKNSFLRFEISPSQEESASMTDEDWKKLADDFLTRMGLKNHQYVVVKHRGTETKPNQAHLHLIVNRVSLSRELYKDNWIGKRSAAAANSIAKERNFVQAADVGKKNREEIKECMDKALMKMKSFDFDTFKVELRKLGCTIREARASTGKLNGYYVTGKSGTEYKASEIGKAYTLANIEKRLNKLSYNLRAKSNGRTNNNSGGFHL